MNANQLVMEVFQRYDGYPIRIVARKHPAWIGMLKRYGYNKEDMNAMCLYAMCKYFPKYQPIKNGVKSGINNFLYIVCRTAIWHTIQKELRRDSMRFHVKFIDQDHLEKISYVSNKIDERLCIDREMVLRLLQECSEYEATIIRRVFGVGCKAEGVKQVGESLGLRHQKICYVVKCAIAKIQKSDFVKRYLNQMDVAA